MKTTNRQNTGPLLKRALIVAAIATLTTVATQSATAANLVARWTLDEAGSPYADSGPNGVQLVQDAATTTVAAPAGHDQAPQGDDRTPCDPKHPA